MQLMTLAMEVEVTVAVVAAVVVTEVDIVEVVIAVVDDGIQYDHPDLADAYKPAPWSHDYNYEYAIFGWCAS